MSLIDWLFGRKHIPSTPERVLRLINEIEDGEFGGVDFNETGVSMAWIYLPKRIRISARWYPDGSRSELNMCRGVEDWTELPHDKWSEMILQTIIDKTRADHTDKLSELLA